MTRNPVLQNKRLMAVVVFYEKPGCASNAKQKQLLRESGHEVIEQSVLTHNWSTGELLRFFGSLPVSEWFNQSAPRIKYGKINPSTLEPAQAITLMLADPLLIRRPLMQANDSTMVGFDSEAVNNWIGLRKRAVRVDHETCSRTDSKMVG